MQTSRSMSLPTRLRHVTRNRFHYITVELNAVIMRKGIHVDGGVGPVKRCCELVVR